MGVIFVFQRETIESSKIYGEIVKESDQLVLVHNEYEFQFDGYCVFRKSDVSNQYPSESNEYCQELMVKEGLWEEVPEWVRDLNVDSWQSLLQDFLNRVIILEDEKERDFLIGPVVDVGDQSASLHYFDGCGRFEEIEEMEYEDITIMKFGDRYSTIHAKYLKW